MSAGLIKGETVMSIIQRVEEIIEENKCLEMKVENLIKKRRQNVEELIKENQSLEESEAILTKKRQENVTKISYLLNETKRVSRGATGASDGNDSKIEEMNGSDSESWEWESMHDGKIEVQMDLRDEEPTPSRLEVSRKRNLDLSVPYCGKIVPKIPRKELAAITPRKLKVEDKSPEASLVCNFYNCSRSFTCASTFVSHLQNHYAQKGAKFDCPIDGCGYSSTRASLTTHMRAKHTEEELFSCESCPKKFHSLAAKVQHENKHLRPDIWAQCARQDCLKFYQFSKGNCKSCGGM